MPEIDGWGCRDEATVGDGDGGGQCHRRRGGHCARPGNGGGAEDYCTLSPDVGYVPVYYNFTNSCAGHDWCSETKPYEGVTANPRKSCDDDFRASMKSSSQQLLPGLVPGTCPSRLSRHRRRLLRRRAGVRRRVLLS